MRSAMELKAEKKDHDDDESGGSGGRRRHNAAAAAAAAASVTAMDVDANGGECDELSDQEIVEVGIDEDHIKFLTSMHSGDEEPMNGVQQHRDVRSTNGVTGNGREGSSTVGKMHGTTAQRNGGLMNGLQKLQQHQSINGTVVADFSADDSDDEPDDEEEDDDDDEEEDVMVVAANILSKTAQRSSLLVTERTYQCDVCPRIFHRPDHLRYHMRIHEKNNPFECKLCFSVFASDPAFAHHIRTEHAGMGLADALPPVPETEAHRFACTYCDRTYGGSVELEEHLHQQHLGERPYKCNMCPKAFIRMDFLQCHYLKYHSFHPMDDEEEEEEEEGDGEEDGEEDSYRRMEQQHQQQQNQFESRAKRPRLMLRKIEDLVDERSVTMKGRFSGVSRRTSHTGTGTSISSDDRRDEEDEDDDGDDEGTGAESSDQHQKLLQRGREGMAGGRNSLPKLSSVHSRFLVAMEEQHSKRLAAASAVPVPEDCSKHRCPVCDRGFAREPDLMVHVRTHPDLPTFKCPLCELTFIGSDFLKNHLKKHVIGNGEDPGAPGAIDLKAGPPADSKPTAETGPAHPLPTVLPSMAKLPKPIITSKPPSTGISLLKPIEERKPPDHQQEYCVKTADGKFMCTVCERLFSHQQTVRIHFRIHTNEKPYKCAFCEESYIRSDYLERHLKVHFKDGMLPAAAIASMAAAAAAAAATGGGGNRSATSTPPPGSAVVKEEFGESGPATPVAASGTGSTGKPLIGRAGLAPENYHFTEANDGQFVCKICDAVFSQVALLRKHALAHTEEKPFHCDICDRSFNRVDYLKEHFKSKRHLQLVAEAAAGTVTVDDEDDDSTMDETSNRMKHGTASAGGSVSKAKAVESGVVNNGLDGRGSNSSSNSSSGSSSSSSSSSSSNSSSRSSSSSRSNNNSANPSPVKQKPNDCSVVGEVGETPPRSAQGEFHRSDYERTSDGRYKCNQCDKTFVTAVTLKMHIRLHTGEKPYKCDKCDKAFIRSDYLKTHEKCHRQESFLNMLSLTTSKEPSIASEAGESDGEVGGGGGNDTDDQSNRSLMSASRPLNGGSSTPRVEPLKIANIAARQLNNGGQEDDSEEEEAEDEEEQEEEEESDESEDEQVIEVMVKEASCSESEDDEEEDGEDEEEDEDDENEEQGRYHQQYQSNPNNSTNRITNNTMIGTARKEKSASKRRNRSKAGSNRPSLTGGCDSSNNGFDHEDDSTSQASGPGTQYGAGGSEPLVNGQKGKHRCLMCDKLFAWPKSLKIHLRTHTGEKPYRCDVCGKCFGRSDSLRGHKRTHADDKLMQCHLCDLSCANAADLVQHQYTVHGLQPLES